MALLFIVQLSPETTLGSTSLLAVEELTLVIENDLLKENSFNDFTAIAKLGVCVCVGGMGGDMCECV